ncbi:hypothetical protein BC624_102128 [Flavobacterium granuli]|uniref:Uncharacterized protein n=1 Tax=Flavobacterium granuli TaxID=280093 RepID=A0A1M5K4Y0_9FLAO|nr:hypothetical protein BC624_102128 [Flavobacterium granuli]SHG47845.1 hypothetical protein SAMN05443373_102128 [Flavobacterium granuli]
MIIITFVAFLQYINSLEKECQFGLDYYSSDKKAMSAINF